MPIYLYRQMKGGSKMKIEVEYKKNICIVRPKGEIIGEGSRWDLKRFLDDEIEKKECPWIILDLEGVPSMDSIALRMLVAAYTALTRKEKGLVLLNVGQDIKDLLTITALSHLFEKYDDEEEAIQSLF
ncbi:MAG: STAS domain-containing protein [bacterium]|nr:STAS domain-containing protein [bacterium]